MSVSKYGYTVLSVTRHFTCMSVRIDGEETNNQILCCFTVIIFPGRKRRTLFFSNENKINNVGKGGGQKNRNSFSAPWIIKENQMDVSAVVKETVSVFFEILATKWIACCTCKQVTYDFFSVTNLNSVIGQDEPNISGYFLPLDSEIMYGTESYSTENRIFVWHFRYGNFSQYPEFRDTSEPWKYL